MSQDRCHLSNIFTKLSNIILQKASHFWKQSQAFGCLQVYLENTFKSSVLPLHMQTLQASSWFLVPFLCHSLTSSHQLFATPHATKVKQPGDWCNTFNRLLLTQLHIFQSNSENILWKTVYTAFFFKYTIFVHLFNKTITNNFWEFFYSRIVSSGWKMQ